MKKRNASTFLLKTSAIFLLGFSNFMSAFAQVPLAGSSLGFYSDILPDTTINYFYNGSNESIDFDLSGDLMADLRIHSYSVGGLGGATRYIEAVPLDSNCSILFGRWDSTYNNFYNFWQITKVAHPLALGDTINYSHAVWYKSYLMLSDNSGSGGTYSNISDWLGSNDKFIGVRHINQLDTNYAWIRVNLPSVSACVVKDYSYKSTVGIEHIELNSNFNIFPNPSSTSFFLTSHIPINNLRFQLLNYRGELVTSKVKTLNDRTIELDTKELAKGIYLVKVVNGAQIEAKKIMVSH